MATLLGGRGVAILFFTIVIALFGYFIYFLAVGNTDPAYYWQQSGRGADAPLTPDAPRSKAIADALTPSLILVRDEATTIGRLRFTYLGIVDRQLRFDVHLLDLDPNFAYRYNIPLERAKKRFRIAEQYFQAHATSQSKVRLTQIFPQ